MLIPRALANQVEQSCYVVVYVILTEILESGYVRSLIPGYTSHSLILLMSLFGKCERTIPYQEKTPNSTQQSTSFEVQICWTTDPSKSCHHGVVPDKAIHYDL